MRSKITSRGVSVFSVKSGRHRGDFVGCPTNIRGFVVLPDSNQLVAGCRDGKMRFWDFEGAMEQVREFEASFVTLGTTGP